MHLFKMNKTQLQKILLSDFPGKVFTSSVLKQATKKLKNGTSETDVISFLSKEYKPFVKRDFKPVVKCNIVFSSLPIEDLSYYKVNKSIQEIIYSLPNTKLNKPEGISAIEKWHSDHKLDFVKIHIQAFNHIFNHSFATYTGVEIKATNKYDKQLLKIEKRNKNSLKEKLNLPEKPIIFDENNCLIDKPGINETLYGYQRCDLKHLEDPKIIQQLPIEHQNYSRKNNDLISIQYNNEKVFGNKRRKMGGKVNNPILLYFKFENNFIVFDARALLRHVYYRGLAKPGTLTIKDLLDFFTKDPVILKNSKGIWQVALSFKEEVLQTPTLKVFNSIKKAKDSAQEICKQKNTCKIATIDLGQTNKLAYQINEVININNTLEIISANKTNHLLTSEQINYINKINSDHDKLKEDIFNEAVSKLTSEQQIEVNKYKQNIEQESKKYIETAYCIPIDQIDWDNMSSSSCQIADYLIYKNLDTGYFKKQENKKKYDSAFAKEAKYKLNISSDINKNIQENSWEIQRHNSKYNALAQTQKEFCRSIANKISKQVDIIVIEDLVMNGGFFDGKGKRDKGWVNFFSFQKENKWWIKAFHKAFSDLAPNHGKNVFEINPCYTSITCTNCSYCDKENRKGENFKCKKCNYTANTDLDIAPLNLLKQVITGEKLKGCERLSDEKKTRSTRSHKGLKSVGNPTTLRQNVSIEHSMEDALANQLLTNGNS